MPSSWKIVAYKLGFKKQDFIPVHIEMNTIHREDVKLLGAMLLRFSSHAPNVDRLEMAQISHRSNTLTRPVALENKYRICAELPLKYAAQRSNSSHEY